MPRAFPRLEKEAFRGFLSSFAFSYFACHSLHLPIFVNNICVHCQMQTLLLPVCYAREHYPCLELYPGLRRRHLGA